MWKECPLCLSNVLHNCLVKPFLSFLNFFCCCCLYFFIICFYPVCVCDPFYIWFVHTYVQCTIWDIVRIFAYFSYENYIVICALTEQVREKLVILNNAIIGMNLWHCQLQYEQSQLQCFPLNESTEGWRKNQIE